MTARVWAWFSFVLLGISSFSRVASAQDLGVRADDGERRHRIRVRAATPGLGFELFRFVDGAPLVRCDAECVIALRPGKYRLRLLERGAPMGERTVLVQEPATWSLSPNDPALRTLGLGLGIAGPVLLVAGALLTMPALMSGMCHDSEGCTTPDERQGAAIGFFALVGGAIATPVGWTLFAKNVRPGLELEPFDAPGTSSARPPSWSLELSATF